MIEAFEAGEISLRQFELLSRLTPKQQQRRIDEGRRSVTAQKIAADVISKILSESGKEVDLSLICAVVTRTVCDMGCNPRRG